MKGENSGCCERSTTSVTVLKEARYTSSFGVISSIPLSALQGSITLKDLV